MAKFQNDIVIAGLGAEIGPDAEGTVTAGRINRTKWDQNAGTAITVSNTTAGTSSDARVEVISDTGAGIFRQCSTLINDGSSPTFLQGKTVLSSNASSAGLTFRTVQAGTGFEFYNASTQLGDITSAGEWTYARQPSFLATAALQSNVTGNGASLDPVVFATEVDDRGSDYLNSVFTAPVDGLYALCVKIGIADLTAAMTTGDLRIVTSNRSYLHFANFGAMRTATNRYIISQTIVADMDAADEAKITLVISNGAGDTADVEVGSVFSGWLLG